MGSRLTKQTVAIAILAICIAAAFSLRTALAAGDQYGASEDDIQMSVDYRWAGGGVGGYYPIRIALQNRGLSRNSTSSSSPCTAASFRWSRGGFRIG